jgi:hypothetical protein
MEYAVPSNFSPTYYWDNFQYVLRYVDKHYKNLLNPDEIEFISTFNSLPISAQYLYLRLCGRRVAWFNRHQLKYVEIESLDSAIETLIHVGFVRSYGEKVFSASLLQVFTKQTCVDFIDTDQPKTPFKSLSKQALVDLLTDQALSVSFVSETWISPLKLELYTFITFLFFGSRNRDLTEFVVRDLGHRQYIEIDELDFQPYFNTRKEIEDKWLISLWRDWFYENLDKISPVEIQKSFFESLLPLSDNLSELAVPAYERVLFQVGRHLERQTLLEDALEIYELAASAQALERRVRILAKLKRLDDAIRWAEFGMGQVDNPTELHFFQDFLARQASKKQVKQVTARLGKANKIEIDESYKGRVEQGLIDYYQSQGYFAVFSENSVWKNLLGLLTWELIFTDRSAGFHHPFQYAPTVDFTQENPERFQELIHLLADRSAALQHMRSIADQHHGIINPLVDWVHLNWELLTLVLNQVDTKALQQVLVLMWSRLSTHAKGFPDLFISRGDEFVFVEVKSPNDHLSAIQHFWHDSFAELGIPFQLIRVVWK